MTLNGGGGGVRGGKETIRGGRAIERAEGGLKLSANGSGWGDGIVMKSDG